MDVKQEGHEAVTQSEKVMSVVIKTGQRNQKEGAFYAVCALTWASHYGKRSPTNSTIKRSVPGEVEGFPMSFRLFQFLALHIAGLWVLLLICVRHLA